MAKKTEADALDLALAAIRKDFGAGAIRRLGEDALPDIEVIPTGVIALDEALGIRGLPRGRVIELYGPESSGKTTLALQAIAMAQKSGDVAAFIDAEHALDPEWADTLGVNTDDLFVSQPSSGEEALQIADVLTQSGKIGIIVVDSVAALVPRAELAGDIGDAHMAAQARMMSQALRKITGSLSSTRTCIIFINQLREKVGVFFGNSETQPGGKALKFYSSIRMDIRRIETLKDGTVPVGNRVRVKVVKNKCARPFRQAEFDLIYDQGISREGELLDLGLERGLVKKSGAFYSYNGESLGQGKEKARAALCGQSEVAAALEAAIRSIPVPGGMVVTRTTEPDDGSPVGTITVGDGLPWEGAVPDNSGADV